MRKRQNNINLINSILWMQNETAVSPETFLINGKEPPSREMQRKLSSWLTSGWFTSKWKEERDWVKWKENEIKQQKPISHNLLFLKGKSHYLIQGCVNEVDESGRKMPYIFCQHKVRGEIVDGIKAALMSLGKTANEADLNTITDYLNFLKEKKKRIRFLTFGLIALIIALIIILYLNDKYWNNQYIYYISHLIEIFIKSVQSIIDINL